MTNPEEVILDKIKQESKKEGLLEGVKIVANIMEPTIEEWDRIFESTGLTKEDLED